MPRSWYGCGTKEYWGRAAYLPFVPEQAFCRLNSCKCIKEAFTELLLALEGSSPKRRPGLKWQISGFTDRATMPNGKVGFGFSGPNCTINPDVQGNSNTPSEATLSTFQLVNLSTALRFFASLTPGTNPKRVLWGKGGGGKLGALVGQLITRVLTFMIGY